MQTPARRLHEDTGNSIRVAPQSAPARLWPEDIRRGLAALMAAVSAGPPTSPAHGLSQADVARLLGCSRWSIRRLIAAGRLTSRRLLGGLIRYDRVEVEALLAGAQEDGE